MATLTEVFPCFFLSCKTNAKVKPAKTDHGLHSSKFLCCSMYCLCCSTYFCVVLCIFVLFYVFLCCSMYFCVVLCIFVLFYVFLFCSMYCLCCSTYFCVVLCIFVLFYVFLCCSMYFCVVLRIFVLFYVFLCCSMYFCVVLRIFVSFSVLFVCICVLNYCHRVATQLQLNISYHIIFTFAPCMLLYLFYSKPTHALFLKHIHIHI